MPQCGACSYSERARRRRAGPAAGPCSSLRNRGRLGYLRGASSARGACMMHGIYKGRRVLLRNEFALLRPDPRSRRHWLAQFDQVGGTYQHDLCHGWHRFKRSEFRARRSYSRSHWAKVLREHCQRGFHSFAFDSDFCTGCGVSMQQAREKEGPRTWTAEHLRAWRDNLP